MPTIKVRDLAWARLHAPDLDAMEEFLTHFGLIRAARTPTALYMRGTDPAHHLHVTEKAPDAGFVGFAYHAASEEDLARVATAPGASSVESIDEPGGRERRRPPARGVDRAAGRGRGGASGGAERLPDRGDLGARAAAADRGGCHPDE